MARLSTIISDLETGIGQITTLAGYPITWGSVNQFDQALVTYPCADITYPRDTAMEALGLGRFGFSEAEIEIKIRSNIGTITGTPPHDVDDDIDTAVRAIRRRLEKFVDGSAPGTSLGVDSYIYYQSTEREQNPKGDGYVPKTAIIRCAVKYQDRD